MGAARHSYAKAKPDNNGRPSEALRYEGEEGDVQEIPGWLINVRHEGQRDWSGGLDEAQRDKATDGKGRAAVVFYRASRGVGEHFVLLSLEDFASALATEGTR